MSSFSSLEVAFVWFRCFVDRSKCRKQDKIHSAVGIGTGAPHTTSKDSIFSILTLSSSINFTVYVNTTDFNIPYMVKHSLDQTGVKKHLLNLFNLNIFTDVTLRTIIQPFKRKSLSYNDSRICALFNREVV